MANVKVLGEGEGEVFPILRKIIMTLQLICSKSKFVNYLFCVLNVEFQEAFNLLETHNKITFFYNKHNYL